MKALVTGVKGTLGGMLAADLAAAGHKVLGADFLQAEVKGAECVAADMRDYNTCVRLGKGMDVIAHMGAYHGAHLERNNGDKTEKDFFDANIAGTFNMLRSAVENKVPKLVYASSVVLYERDNWQIFGIYSLTKVVGEEMCRFFNREHGLSVIALRYGTFSFKESLARCFEMLGGGALGNWIEPEEVARATRAAVENKTIDFGIYDVQTPLPFTPEEQWEYLRGDKVGMLSRRWPQYAALFEKYADRLPPRINTIDMRRSLRELDWKVERDFEWFLRELAALDKAGGKL